MVNPDALNIKLPPIVDANIDVPYLSFDTTRDISNDSILGIQNINAGSDAKSIAAAMGDMRFKGFLNGIRANQEGPSVRIGPVSIVGGTLDQRLESAKAVRMLSTTDRGRYMLDVATKSVEQEYIYLSPGLNDYIGNYKYRSVVIDPVAAKDLLLPTTKGLLKTPLPVLIGHEMGHAFLNIKDDGPGRMNNVRLNENPIRVQLGYPERTRYGEAK